MKNKSINLSASSTITGAKSIPPKTVGTNFLINEYTGSVKRISSCTTGLYGSGRTQLMSAEMMMTHTYMLITVLTISAIAIKNVDKITLQSPLNHLL